MSYIGITTNTRGEVVVIVGDKGDDRSTEMTPGAARRVAIKLLEAIGEAEWINTRNGNGRKEIEA